MSTHETWKGWRDDLKPHKIFLCDPTVQLRSVSQKDKNSMGCIQSTNRWQDNTKPQGTKRPIEGAVESAQSSSDIENAQTSKLSEDSTTPTHSCRPAPDIRDMHAVHNVFRHALSDPAAVLGRVQCHDTAQCAAVAQYYDMVLDFIHSHHGSEDDLLWPVLLQRCTAQEAALVHTGEAQHAAVCDSMSACVAALSVWRAAPSDADALSALVSALQAMSDALVPHLQDEEAHVMPLVRKYMSAAEYGKVPGGTMSKLAPRNLYLAIGYARAQFNQELLDGMDANMPAPVAAGWATEGKAAYEQLHGVMAPLLQAEQGHVEAAVSGHATRRQAAGRSKRSVNALCDKTNMHTSNTLKQAINS